ncbi:MAG: glycosyltransferase family 2 protein [Xanthomonadales bacterium]|nr:glycosyltransferase family 2 protein [Xanthomonadales bacterium]
MKTSIVITTYNYGAYVERCIRSCMNQRHVENSCEIIVVNDASTDGTEQIIEKFGRFANIHVINNPVNVGVAESANIGIRAAVGQFVVRVDADDYISELFVYMLQCFLEANHEVLGVGCDYHIVDEDENVIERCSSNEKPISCGILYRRDLLVRAGLYNPDYRHCEEEELRRRIGSEYSILRIPLPLYRYRMHRSNKTKQSDYLEFRDRFRAGQL